MGMNALVLLDILECTVKVSSMESFFDYTAEDILQDMSTWPLLLVKAVCRTLATVRNV